MLTVPNFNFANIGLTVQRTQVVQTPAQTAQPTQSIRDLQNQILTLQGEKKALEDLNNTLQNQKIVLQSDKTGLVQINTQLLSQVQALRQQSTKNAKEKDVVTKVLSLAVLVLQKADSIENLANKIKTDADDLLKQAETSVVKAKTSSPNSNEAKAAENAHEKAKLATTNALKKVTAALAISKKIQKLANDLITGKSKIDNQSVAKLEKEQATLVNDAKALAVALVALQKEVHDVVKFAEAATKQVVKQLSGGDTWDVIGPLFGFGNSTITGASGAGITDNWGVIETIFGFSTAASEGNEETATERVSATNTTVANLIGDYENHLYNVKGKNDWHFVTISRVDDQKLKWTNRAGVSWTLTVTSDKTKLSVGSDCPYFKQGYKTATVQWAGGAVTSILGPSNEPYYRN